MIVELTSAHLSGDPLLLEIVNDPDTGTAKLQPGSPPESVIRLQQALVDLNWTNQVQPPITDIASFVIGVYGPLTTKTVLAYKTRYKIRYPPNDPNGVIDGLAGPRTLLSLDRHCHLLEEASAALAVKAAEVEAATGEQFRGSVVPVLRTQGAATQSTGGGAPGQRSALWWLKGVGASHVRAPFFEPYFATGASSTPPGYPERGPLGFPVGDAFEVSDGVIRQNFEHAYLLWDAAQGTMTTVTEDHSPDLDFGTHF